MGESDSLPIVNTIQWTNMTEEMFLSLLRNRSIERSWYKRRPPKKVFFHKAYLFKIKWLATLGGGLQALERFMHWMGVGPNAYHPCGEDGSTQLGCLFCRWSWEWILQSATQVRHLTALLLKSWATGWCSIGCPMDGIRRAVSFTTR